MGGGGAKCFARTHITTRRRHGIAQNLLRPGREKKFPTTFLSMAQNVNLLTE